MSSEKRKRIDFSLKQKLEIIDASKNEPNQTKLAKEMSKKWGIDVKRTTVKSILSKRKEIEAAVDGGIPTKRKKLTSAQNLKVDEGVLMWLKQARQQNLPVGGDLLKEKAKNLAELLGVSNFSASEGWLDRFKQRHSITFKSVQGEAGAVNLQPLLEWQQQVLKPLISQYSENDIFNMDETGLFWKLLPNKTMSLKGERCTGGKRSKERITLLVGANMSGTEKLPLLAIGRSKKPRAFRNKEVPVKYQANSRSWMTAKIFENEMIEWDKQVSKQGRKVLLFLDNFAGHPDMPQLDNIKMVFFPPNTTSHSQPMDQGIIENLKRHYKKVLLKQRLQAMDLGKEFSFTLLDALHVVHNAWDQVSQTTIKNCFAKAKFVESDVRTEPDDAELLEIWKALPAAEKIYDNE
jgi:hypothetical protein